ncbi:hypothetical protein [Mucisphaera sp.]|uniref:hypothetical protein n=1 Tax=Mucisphaera sp. TaxID=2913024 RepID=UPI003D128F9D
MIDADLAPIAQLGAAGVMGLLWVWERNLSGKRERELTEAHTKLMSRELALHEVVELVRQNACALERFEQTEQRLARAVELLAERIGGVQHVQQPG